ncbi:hypothetical protein M8J76_013824 [Diaphorina citri]|nr:hypothetical protein M8J76_013824 [Diaphorina citri]
MNALHQQGVPKPYIDILEKIYDSSIGKIKLEKVGPPFRLERGVRQGDPISPKLFTALLEQVFRNIDWDEHMGININGKTLSNLRFADDIALFAENHEDIQRMLQHLSKESEKVGLKINESKTKIMTNNTREETKLNDKIMEYWYPRDGVRRAGRPTTRWRESLHKAVGPLWTHEAQNREHWKLLGEALAPDGDVAG